MPTGEFGIWDEHRNQQLNYAVHGTDIATGTATAGAITQNAYAGKITTDASSAASDAEYTLTITNNKIAAADMVFVSFRLSSGTANNVSLKSVTPAAGSVAIELQNPHDADAWSSAIFVISYFVVKAL
jgi:hypothetical protein